jgi:hypothetical protein
MSDIETETILTEIDSVIRKNQFDVQELPSLLRAIFSSTFQCKKIRFNKYMDIYQKIYRRTLRTR